MLKQFAKDELRHDKMYQQFVARHIQRDPKFRRVVLKVFLKATSPLNQVSGGPAQFLEHLERGVFYFRKAEFDFFLNQVEYLLGTRLDSLFRLYFEGNIPPCELCSREVIDCTCEHLEVAGLPAEPLPEYVPPEKAVVHDRNLRTGDILERLSGQMLS